MACGGEAETVEPVVPEQPTALCFGMLLEITWPDGEITTENCEWSSRCDLENLRCTEDLCEAGHVRCNDGWLQQCRDDRLGWTALFETCP